MSENNGLNLLITEYGGLRADRFRDCGRVKTVSSETLVSRAIASENTDIVILLYTAGHESAAAEAVKAADSGYVAVLLLCNCPVPASVLKKCEAAGVLTGHIDSIGLMLPAAVAMRRRLQKLENKTGVLQKKLDETKLITRAKLLLMTRLQMSESEAHRYIEKRAMDTSAKRRDIAESIIKTYEG